MWSRKFSCIWELTIASGGIALHVDCLWVDVLCEDKAKRRVQRVSVSMGVTVRVSVGVSVRLSVRVRVRARLRLGLRELELW